MFILISLVVINIAIIVIKIYNICHFIYFSNETLDEMSILEKLKYSDFCISRFKLDNNFNQNYADLIEYFGGFDNVLKFKKNTFPFNYFIHYFTDDSVWTKSLFTNKFTSKEKALRQTLITGTNLDKDKYTTVLTNFDSKLQVFQQDLIDNILPGFDNYLVVVIVWGLALIMWGTYAFVTFLSCEEYSDVINNWLKCSEGLFGINVVAALIGSWMLLNIKTKIIEAMTEHQIDLDDWHNQTKMLQILKLSDQFDLKQTTKIEPQNRSTLEEKLLMIKGLCIDVILFNLSNNLHNRQKALAHFNKLLADLTANKALASLSLEMHDKKLLANLSNRMDPEYNSVSAKQLRRNIYQDLDLLVDLLIKQEKYELDLILSANDNKHIKRHQDVQKMYDYYNNFNKSGKMLEKSGDN